MNIIKIKKTDWDILKVKLQRKYNHLSDDDLEFVEGQEDQLVSRLAKRLHRTRAYILFTLGKQFEDLSSNRL